MSALDGSLLVNPHPCRHIVYPYNDELKAIKAVCLFANSGIAKGESVILIMADSRRDRIHEGLASDGIDLEALQETGQLECLSADQLVSAFMPNGVLDEVLFKEKITAIITKSKVSSPIRRVRVFGEMVSLLFARNEVAIAERMERLWNEIIEAYSISLFCTYRLLESALSILPDSLAKLHSHDLSSWTPGVNAASSSAND